jgi:L-ribulose-5-phosphate 3-epimerase
MKSIRLLLAALALAAATTLPAAEAWKPTIGLQTWTCRNMNFDQVVAFAKKHGLTRLQMIGNHIDPKGPADEALRKKAVLEANGLTCYTFGVAGTSADKEENRKLFEFARLMGIKLIVVEPKNDQALWDGLEELVKEYDIKLAIHNHGRGSVYGDPATVKAILAGRDRRIGVCMDVGWVTAAGFDAAKVFREYDGRVFDIHLKDKKTEQVDGKEVHLDVEVGKGDANYAGLFAELKKARWNGVMAIETDNGTFASEPTAFVKAALAFAGGQGR